MFNLMASLHWDNFKEKCLFFKEVHVIFARYHFLPHVNRNAAVQQGALTLPPVHRYQWKNRVGIMFPYRFCARGSGL